MSNIFTEQEYKEFCKWICKINFYSYISGLEHSWLYADLSDKEIKNINIRVKKLKAMRKMYKN